MPDQKGVPVTLLLYRVAIGPVLLALAGWSWELQKENNRLQQENAALFATTASLERWARESRKQAAYLEGIKDAIVSGAAEPHEISMRLEVPGLADTYASAAPAPIVPFAWESDTADSGDESSPAPPAAAVEQAQMPAVDYDQLPEITASELKRYRQSKTSGAE